MNPYLRLILIFLLAGGLYAGSGAWFEYDADRPFDQSKFISDWVFFGVLMVLMQVVLQRKTLFKNKSSENE